MTEERRLQVLINFVRGFSLAIGVVAALILIFTIGPWVETRLFPAVSKLNILTMTPNAAGDTIITASFDKKRDCEYIGIAWFHGRRGSDMGFERVPLILQRREGDTSSPNRPMGRQQAGPWIIAIPPAEIAGNSFAELYHRCHPFWVSRTEFYP